MIISNNCLGGFLYANNGKRFDNPFIWSRIDCSSYKILFSQFDSLNYKDVDLKSNDDIISKDRPSIQPHQFSIIIQNAIRVQFNHVKYDAKALEPYKKKVNDFAGDVFTRYPYKIVWENYFRRLERFGKSEPCFIFMNDAPQFDTKSELIELIELANKLHKKLFFLTNDAFYTKYNSEYVEVIYLPGKLFSFEHIVNAYSKKFYDFMP